MHYALLHSSTRILCSISKAQRSIAAIPDGYEEVAVPDELPIALVPDADGWMQPRTWPVGATVAADMGFATRAEADACPWPSIPDSPDGTLREVIRKEARRRIAEALATEDQVHELSRMIKQVSTLTQRMWNVIDGTQDVSAVRTNVEARLAELNQFKLDFEAAAEPVRTARDAMLAEVAALTVADTLLYAEHIRKQTAVPPRTVDWPV